MTEKSADQRHFEHDDIVRRLGNVEEDTKDNEETIGDFITRQTEYFSEFRIELLKEVHAIKDSISAKCEQDSAIISRQNRELQRVDRMEGDQRKTAETLAVVVEGMRALKADTDKSLKAAHDAYRKIEEVHGKRLEKLEHKGGKLALKILYGIAGVAGTAGITLGVQRLLGGG